MVLTVSNLSCVKGNQSLFRNVSFSVMPGAVLYIRGGNGTGKSSLLKLLTGLVDFSTIQGQLLWNNQNIAEIQTLYMADVRYIGHVYPIQEELTVRDNILFWADIFGTSMLVEAAMSYFNLMQFAEVKMNKLSQGFKKKVMLSILCSCPSHIWLLDEPFVNLDYVSRINLMNLIKVRANEGGIVIITTHEIEPLYGKDACFIDLERFARGE